MSTEASLLSSEELSRAIREKVEEAHKRQRQLSEAAIRGRAVLGSLRHTLDEIGAYMHRETGLDVVALRETPRLLADPMSDSPTAKTSIEHREIDVPTEPPTTLLGGFQVRIAVDGAVTILAFWVAGSAGVESGKWTELFESDAATLDAIVKKASEALYSRRHLACELLLEALS